MVFFDYLDWTRAIGSGLSAKSIVLNFPKDLDQQGEARELSRQLRKLIIDVNGLGSLPDTWREPNETMPGFEIIRKFLATRRSSDETDAPHDHALKLPQIGVAIDGMGMIAISIAVASDELADFETDARRFDNFALILAHLIKRSINENIKSGEIPATTAKNHEQAYRVRAVDPVPIALERPDDHLDSQLNNPKNLDRRVKALLDVENQFRWLVRESANAEARTTTPVAMLALSRRQLRLRDRLMASVDKYSESYRRSRRTAVLSRRLAFSIIAISTLFLGVLVSQTALNALGYGPLELSKAASQTNSEDVGLANRLLFIGVSAALVVVGLALYSTVSLGQESSLRRRYMFLQTVLFGMANLVMGATLPLALAWFFRWELCDPIKNGEKYSCELATNLPGHLTISENEASLLGFAILVVSLIIFGTVAKYQTEAERHHQKVTHDSDVPLDVNDLGDNNEIRRAKWILYPCLLLSPFFIFVVGYLLFQFEFLPDSTGSENTTQDGQNPTGTEQAEDPDTAIYTSALKKIGWALPVLSISILVQIWIRFAESGALTLIHDVTIARLAQISTLIKSDEELVERISTVHQDAEEKDTPTGSEAELTRAQHVSHLPNMKREVELGEAKSKGILAMKNAIYNEYLRRVTLVAASVLLLLQVPPLRQFIPNEKENGSGAVKIAAVDSCPKTVDPDVPCHEVDGVGDIVVNVDGERVEFPNSELRNGADLNVALSLSGQTVPTRSLGSINVTPSMVPLAFKTDDGSYKAQRFPSLNRSSPLTFVLPSQPDVNIAILNDGKNAGTLEGLTDGAEVKFVPEPIETLNVAVNGDEQEVKLLPLEIDQAHVAFEVSALPTHLKVTLPKPTGNADAHEATLTTLDGEATLNLDVEANAPGLLIADAAGTTKFLETRNGGGLKEEPTRDGLNFAELALVVEPDVRPTPVTIVDPFGPTPVTLGQGNTINFSLPQFNLKAPNMNLTFFDIEGLALDVGRIPISGTLSFQDTQTNVVVGFELDMDVEATPPATSTNIVQNFILEWENVTSLSGRNGLLLPFFPDPVKAPAPNGIDDETTAFNWGWKEIKPLAVIHLPNDDSEPGDVDTAKVGTAKVEHFLFDRIVDPLVACIKMGATVEIDVLGFASASWIDADVPKDELNYALAEGRRIGLLQQFNSVLEREGQKADRVMVVVKDRNAVALSTLLKEIQDGPKGVPDWQAAKQYTRFTNPEDMFDSRKEWMRKSALGETGTNPFEELFARSVVLTVNKVEGSRNCATHADEAFKQ